MRESHTFNYVYFKPVPARITIFVDSFHLLVHRVGRVHTIKFDAWRDGLLANNDLAYNTLGEIKKKRKARKSHKKVCINLLITPVRLPPNINHMFSLKYQTIYGEKQTI